MGQRVLVIGATGRLGRHVVNALHAEGHAVLALIRADPARETLERRALLDRYAQSGVTFLAGSLEDIEILDRGMREVDAVISCIDHRPDHLRLQANIATVAARLDHIARVIPSQFGIDSRLYGETRVEHGDFKRKMQAVFERSGVPFTFVHTNGLASDWAGSLGQLGLPRPPTDEVEVYGRGDVRFSMVALEDAARYAVRALFDERTQNKHVAIIPPTNILTQLELIEIWERKTGRSLRRVPVSATGLDERIEQLARDPAKRSALALAQLVRAAWIDGLGDGRRLAEVAELTELYPDIRYRSIPAYLERYLDA
jgi:pinoresinol/lariciresinol reductase